MTPFYTIKSLYFVSCYIYKNTNHQQLETCLLRRKRSCFKCRQFKIKFNFVFRLLFLHFLKRLSEILWKVRFSSCFHHCLCMTRKVYFSFNFSICIYFFIVVRSWKWMFNLKRTNIKTIAGFGWDFVVYIPASSITPYCLSEISVWNRTKNRGKRVICRLVLRWQRWFLGT